MLAIELVPVLTRLTYVLIAGLTLLDFLRQRDRTRLDIALTFGMLAFSVLVQEYDELGGTPPPGLRFLSSAAVILQPYLLLRLVAHFRPVAPRILNVAAIGLAVSLALLALPLLLALPALPLPAVIFVVVYFAWAEGYASVAFVRGALTTAGVTRRRYLLAALGALLLAGAILVAGLLAAFPNVAVYSQPTTQFLALVSGVAFYLGFAPPRWVRKYWQYSELARFLQVSGGQPVRERAGHILTYLCETAQRALGGSAAVAALQSGPEPTLYVRASTLPSVLGQTLQLTPGPLLTAWTEQRAIVANHPRELSAAGADLLAMVGGEALCAMPIATPEHARGLLIVMLPRPPLFPDDDVELLRLFAEQAALTLDQNALLDEQNQLIERLRERGEQLEAANQELEAFSYSVSHDLRAPLRHIEGFTDLLTRSDVTEPLRRQHLQRIRDAAVRMAQLIDSLLTFSRMSRTELHQRPVALDLVVAVARQELTTEMQGRAVEWVIHPLPEARGDPELLRLVFVNLLSNALKYSRGRNPARIEVGAEPAAGSEVVVYVRDNGVGFDMQYSDKLFGVFQRLHHANEFEGIGIGLANVRRIVVRHGGRVWAVGQVNGGATFYIALPAAGQSPAVAAGPVTALPASLEAAAPEGQALRV